MSYLEDIEKKSYHMNRSFLRAIIVIGTEANIQTICLQGLYFPALVALDYESFYTCSHLNLMICRNSRWTKNEHNGHAMHMEVL